MPTGLWGKPRLCPYFYVRPWKLSYWKRTRGLLLFPIGKESSTGNPKESLDVEPSQWESRGRRNLRSGPTDLVSGFETSLIMADTYMPAALP